MPSSPIRTPRLRAPVTSRARCRYRTGAPVQLSPVLEIGHYGEPVALVVAATLEQAQAAANLVRIAYAAEPGHFDFTAEAEKAYAPKQLLFGMPTDSAVGNFDAGYDSAPVKIDHQYNTPYCFSQPMEPNACLAVPARRRSRTLRQHPDRRRRAQLCGQHAENRSAED